MYRIMLVDDEAEIREGIMRRIDWEGCGFTLVATSENGREALEQAETLHPDVVMTDIQMPFMDGLTMGKLLMERQPTVKLVFFSGFDDFEYAQKAISLAAADYILKPINAAELTEVLLRLRAQLDGEVARKRDVEQLRSRYEASLPMLREVYFTRLLEGRMNVRQISALAAQYDIELNGECWCVALLQAENDSKGESAQALGELLPLSIQRMLEEGLEKRHLCRTLLYNDGVAIIGCLRDAGEMKSLGEDLLHLCKQIKRFLDVTVTVGMGSVVNQLGRLRLSTQGAQNALDYRVLVGAGKVILIDDVEPEAAFQVPVDEQAQRALLTAVKLGTPEQIPAAVEKYIGRFRSAKIALGEYRLYVMEMTSELYKIIRAYHLDPGEVFGKDINSSQGLLDFDSLDALGQWFTEACQRASGLIRRERTNTSKALAERAKSFIADNYHNPDISVEMLCDHLHVSPAYFSTVFKKETGASFVSHLTDVRMQAAIALLNTTEMKTYEISQQVGYIEPNYFSYVFKKQFGKSPTKYRSQRA